MSEAIQKKVELILTARDAATKVVDETVNRARQKLSEVGGAGGGGREGDPLRDALGIAKGAGGVAAVKIGVDSLIGSIKSYHDAIAEGRDATQAALHGFIDAIPILSGFQQKLEELAASAMKAKYAQQDALVAAANLEIEQRQQARQKFTADYASEADRQYEQQRLFGKSGVTLEIEQATAKAEQELAKLQALRERVATDIPKAEQRGRYEVIDDKIQNAEIRRDSAIAEAKRRYQDSIEQQEKEHQNRLQEIQSQGRDAELRALGLNLEADLDQIKRAADKEVDAILEAAQKAKDAVPLTGTGQGSMEVAGRYREISRAAEEEQAAVRRRQAQQEDARRLQDAISGKGFSDLFPSLGAIGGFLGGIGARPGAPGPSRNADLIDSRFLTGIAAAKSSNSENGPEKQTAENTGKAAITLGDISRGIDALLTEARTRAAALLPF